ncbi:MAG: hypothetical protein HHJ11_04705 [Phycicoccus sp.]|nr:hypothetical protein [Phycicoccus sp.]NMM34359.1 hypothetical protein [Phycicoccus sp.]
MNPARKRKRRRVLLAVLTSLLLLSGGTYTGVNTASAKGDIQFQISPASQSLARGQAAIYTVTVTSTGGFAGTVGLSASGLPSGATATLEPSALALTASDTGATHTSVLSVTTTSSTPVGSYTLKVTGTSGKISGSITAGLTVNYPLSGALSMTSTPASVTLAPGETAAYTIQLDRTRLPGNVSLKVASGLPAGATAAFAPNVTSGDTSTLQVTTSEGTKDGTYSLILSAAGRDSNGDTKNASASVKLDINTKGKNFIISGNLDGLLAPGLALPLDLSLTNPNKKSISVTNLSVSLQSVTRAAGETRPCRTGDYAVVQYNGPYPLVVPGSTTLNLTQLGVSSNQRPKIEFLNTSYNQDGCKGANLSLSYSGSAQGN